MAKKKVEPAFRCPVCSRPIAGTAPCAEQTYVCFACGATLKVKARETPGMPWYVLLMPPILDMICGMIFGFRTYEVTEVSVVDNPNQTFQPTPERCVFVEIEKAAKAGDAAAQYKMGKEYETGFWVEQGEITALYWYQKSADQGYAPAQQMVGRMHFMGEGTVRDYAESYFWYRVAEKTTGNSEWTESVGRYLSAKQIAAAEERAAAWAPKKSG